MWPLDESNDPSPRSHAELLCQEARHLLALGWGINQAIGNGRIITDAEAAALPGRHWNPWAGHRPGKMQWRVPKIGSFSDLERVHQSFLQRVNGKQYRPPLKLSRFDTVTYHSAASLPPRDYAAFELPEGVAFRQVDVARVAAMLRSLSCRSAKADAHKFHVNDRVIDSEIYVAGHVKGTKRTPPRFSYLPLAAIGLRAKFKSKTAQHVVSANKLKNMPLIELLYQIP
ncbi:MAG: hypothetical protein AMJ79_10420 [Phycisphaerae bacterium SM23_30]|nr:MAG: hypothetical protein AMJ79_10420 [Phycisphaerae bacterium SM23_30]